MLQAAHPLVIITVSLHITKVRLPAATNSSFSAPARRYPKVLMQVRWLQLRRRLRFSNRNRISSQKICTSQSCHRRS